MTKRKIYKERNFWEGMGLLSKEGINSWYRQATSGLKRGIQITKYDSAHPNERQYYETAYSSLGNIAEDAFLGSGYRYKTLPPWSKVSKNNHAHVWENAEEMHTWYEETIGGLVTIGTNLIKSVSFNDFGNGYAREIQIVIPALNKIRNCMDRHFRATGTAPSLSPKALLEQIIRGE